MSTFSRLPGIALVVALVGVAAPTAAAAAQEGLLTARRQATRAELEQAASGAELVAQGADPKTKARLTSQVYAIRQRLQNGDFLPGDRLLLTVLGDSALSDTFTVKPDQRLTLPDVPDISLRGVLDAELASFLTKELSRYLKNPQVTAISLVRLNLTGAIGRPGYMVFPADQLLSDVLMTAGGPSQNANMSRATIRRQNKDLLSATQLSEALRLGRTVGDVSLRDGDEFVVPVQQPGGRVGRVWPMVAGMVLPIFWIVRGTRQRNP